MNQPVLQSNCISRTRNTTRQGNGTSLLNAFGRQSVVQLAIKKICEVLNLFASHTSTGAGSRVICYVNKDELFMDGAGI